MQFETISQVLWPSVLWPDMGFLGEGLRPAGERLRVGPCGFRGVVDVKGPTFKRRVLQEACVLCKFIF